MHLKLAHHVFVAKFINLRAGAVEELLLELGRHILPRGIQAAAVFGHQGIHLAHIVALGIGAHRGNGPLRKAPGLVRQHQLQIHLHLAAQAAAHRTGTEGAVEGKHPWGDFRQADAAVLAGKILAKHKEFPIHYLDIGHPLAHFQGCFHGLCQPWTDFLTDNQPVNNYLNGMLLVFLQGNFLPGIPHFSVNAKAAIALLADMLQELLVLPLLPPHRLGHDHEAGTLRQLQQLIQHLVQGLLVYGLAALGAMRMSHPGKQQPEIIVNLRYRPYRGAGIAAGGLLVNGNGRGKPLNIVHLRLVHLPQELAGIGGQRLHVPPLPLGIDGIKGQGGLP